jgi:hypothetical protein
MNFNPRNFPADLQETVEELTVPAIARVAQWLKDSEDAPLALIVEAYQHLPQTQRLDAGLRQYIFAEAIAAYMEQT